MPVKVNAGNWGQQSAPMTEDWVTLQRVVFWKMHVSCCMIYSVGTVLLYSLKKTNDMFSLVSPQTLQLPLHDSWNLYAHVVHMFVPVGSHWDVPEVETKQRFLERPPLAESVK